MTPQEIVKRPILTERSTDLGERLNQIVFEVHLHANKYQVRDAVEYIYPDIKVTKVRTSIIPGKLKRRGKSIGKRSNWKKAIVSLRKDDVVDFLATE
jgi:large subunit ribosomal protein L23